MALFDTALGAFGLGFWFCGASWHPEAFRSFISFLLREPAAHPCSTPRITSHRSTKPPSTSSEHCRRPEHIHSLYIIISLLLPLYLFLSYYAILHLVKSPSLIIIEDAGTIYVFLRVLRCVRLLPSHYAGFIVHAGWIRQCSLGRLIGWDLFGHGMEHVLYYTNDL
jgi:hypothetical protein